MKKIRLFIKKLRMGYYAFMMDMCAINSDVAREEHGVDSKENIRWVSKYNLYSIEYEKTLMKAV